ncbi:hypothetical protein [Dyella mobilis]|uniref:Uncharacterized protein n=1 Tax=Dyella mobilis TaxID=1849582 RepID=A0ABS2KJN7_9GAMM|nr:hypothetical protein [Dyella mobilis]MBM7131143.1 hypothetical protein [Dyella mobilis]
MSQLGLAPATSASTQAGASGMPAKSSLQQQTTTPQIQQYRSVAATSSALAQALSNGSINLPSATGASSNLTGALQGVWSSLGASSGADRESSSNTTPSFQSFLTTLARNVSESGLTGLRGVFVDMVA